MFRVGIIGGNIGASALISLLKGDPAIELVGIYENKQDSPGVILAKKWDIPVYDDIRFFCEANPEIVINVMGDIKVSNEIRTISENKIEVIEDVGARLLWEIIEKQKKAKIEVLKTVDDKKTIFDIISKIGETYQKNNFFNYMLDKALEIADAPAGSIALKEDDTMSFVASKGLSKKFTENKSWAAISGGLTENIIRNKEIVAINDTLKVDYTRNNPALINEKIRSLVACPIVLKNEVLGILYIDDFKPRQFSERQKASLNLLAALIGTAFEKFALTKNIEDLKLKISNILEISNDAFLLTDPTGQIIFLNDPASELLGCLCQNFSDKNIKIFLKDSVFEYIQRELYSGSILKNYKTVFSASADIEIEVSLNAMPLKDTEGTILGFIFAIRSFKDEQTLRKAIEDKTKEIEDLKRNLEQKVAERTADLEKINKELEYANQLKGRFIANMSHELRTPLNSIIGFSDILLEKTFGELTENQERYIRNIYISGKHLLELINNILDIAKIEAGKYEMIYDTFSVDDVLSEVINIMNPLAENKFIEILVSIGEGVKTITADRVKLKQILYNLLSNAIKFTPEGGQVKVTVALEKNIEGRFPWASPDMEFISFSVKDTGIGISPEDQEKIFDEFGQANSEFSKKYGGAGLGLALTKKLVELHGGTITLESKLGEGSTFTFFIPITSPVEAVTHETMEAVSLNFPWMKEEAPLILVVEDDLSTAELLTLHLTQSGYKVAHAFDGQEAIEKAKNLKPFAITLDVLLPKKDGWEVLQELKSDSRTSDIPVIIHSIVDNKDLAFALGATDYLLKPLDKEALFAKLEELSIAKGKKVTPLSVLIIESEDEATSNFKELLEPQGFLVYTANSGKRGIELASALRPAVILLDFLLPDMLSFDVIKDIKENPSTQDIPIFIITEKDISVEDRMSLVGKIERIVQKYSFDTKELINHIKELELLYPRRAGLIDDLTGVFSHRYFQIRLAQEVERATRYRLPLNLLILDLDHFDQYVKKYGEHYGNLAIKKVAELLKKNIRGSDVIVRYGGDSFAIILPNTVVSAALSLGNRFNAIIRNYPFIYEDSQPKGHLTASIGLTFLDGQTPEELILCAKKALSRAFYKGGDRVEVYSKEHDEFEKVENP